jgi:hypothetical protein
MRRGLVLSRIRTDQFRVSADNVLDALTRKGLLAKFGSDLGERRRLCRVVLVEVRQQVGVRRAETVQKVLAEDPACIRVSGLLYCVSRRIGIEERVIRKTKQERGFSHDLKNGGLSDFL